MLLYELAAHRGDIVCSVGVVEFIVLEDVDPVTYYYYFQGFLDCAEGGRVESHGLVLGDDSEAGDGVELSCV